jgi:hypothetical protein
MSNQTPTPETDALALSEARTDHGWRTLARRLERERDEARAEIANEQKRSDCVSKWYEDEVEAHAKTRAEVARLREAGDKLHLRIAVMLKDWRDGDFSLPRLACIHMQMIEENYRELGKALATVCETKEETK